MAMDTSSQIDVLDMRRCIAAVLDERAQTDRLGMYDTCGAIHVRAAVGLPQIDMPSITQWQQPDGTFDDGKTSGPQHALCVALSSMHLSGQPLPHHVAPLAPTDAAKLPAWLNNLNWSTTHKDLWGATTPLLASGLVDRAWCEVLIAWLKQKPWWDDNNAPWRIISTTYHIASTLDAGCLPYPNAEALLDRLLALQWDRENDDVRCTDCTDGDWAWILLRLCEMCPGKHADVMAAIRRVSVRRVRQWHTHGEAMLAKPTFLIHCMLWGTALFQSVCREDFTGPAMRDTLNDAALFRTR